MELHLVLGSNGSGKSLHAESLAVESGAPLLYIATMVPQNEENHRRIEKHRLQRQGKGFQTVEIPWGLEDAPVTEETVVLLEDVSNLLANGMFQQGADETAALEKILALAGRCRRLIAVSISGLSDEGYSGETADYIHALARLNEELSLRACRVTKMQNGTPALLKSE